MKLAKRFIALAVVAVMLVSSCFVANAATAAVTLTKTAGHNVTSDGKVVFAKYNVYGSVSNHTEASTVLEFNPADGYIPMAFAKNAGSAYTLDEQYTDAIGKYGYEVAGIINGSFFSTADGTLCGNLIVDGKVSCAHVDYYDSFVAFGADGSMNIVNSQLAFTLRINGTEVPNGLAYLNKKYSVCGDWGTDRFFYYDTSCGSAADTSVAGYEIICKKVNNSELAVGQTLFGEVVEIRKSSYGAKFGESGQLSDRFVLFVRDGSANCSYVNNLKVGDTVSIDTEETVAASREIMEKANSVITNVGWLVKDGVDQTNLVGSVGTHDVDGTFARWTAFGQKADGSYVFFTSEGGSTGQSGRSITLKDVAATMMKLGCVNVIRMDGGGSSAMYVSNTGSGSPGYVQSHSRDVSDCILIVKKSSLVDSSLNAELKTLVNNAKNNNPDSETQAIIAEAEAVLASSAPVSGDVKRLIMQLSPASSLKRALSAASRVDANDFNAHILNELRNAYDAGSELYYGGGTEAEFAAAANNINTYLNKSSSVVVSLGASYTVSDQGRDNYLDNGTLLTDGGKGGADAGLEGVYAGWSTGSAEVVLDLGSKQSFDSYKIYLAAGNYGIPSPKSIMKLEVYTSNSKTSGYTLAGTSTEAVLTSGTGNADNTWSTYTMSIAGDIINARYVKFVVTNTGASNKFVWMDEVEVVRNGAPSAYSNKVTNNIYVTSFDASILSGNCNIFTSDWGTVTVANGNHAWTTNVLCTWDSSVGAYVVTKVSKGSGNATPAVTLASNQILICAHSWDTTVPGSSANEALLAKAKVGQKLLCYGVDIANKSMSCAAYIKFIDKDATDPDLELVTDNPGTGEKGDVNGDGTIDMFDYLLVKSFYFEVSVPSDDEFYRADYNDDGVIDMFDYLGVKTAYFNS